MKREIDRALNNMRAEIDRVEILTAALGAFSRPVPDYEPGFHHMQHMCSLSAHEMVRTRDR